MKKVSLLDVAAAAGVSHATVARVLHNSGSVSPATRARVEEKIRELGYIPNQMASALKRDRSGIIGSLCVHNDSGLLRYMNAAIARAAEGRGYELLVLEAEPGEEERAVRSFLSLQADGMVVLSNPLLSETVLALLEKLSVPVVAVERGYGAPWVDNLLVTDFSACAQVARRMAGCGHRRVGLVAAKELPPADIAPALNVERQRLAGFRAGAEAGGLDTDSALTCLTDGYSAGAGYVAAEALLGLAAPPTAIFATSDQLAAGVLQCLYAHRLRVPEDISVVGYDNMLSAQLSPPIDSVALRFSDIGDTVLDFLTTRMEDFCIPARSADIGTDYMDRGTLRRIGAPAGHSAGRTLSD